MKKTIILIFLLLTILIILPTDVQAAAFTKGQSIYIAKNETINDSLYAVGNAVTVEGTINGDLICIGGSIIINGKVTGDVICAGQNITVNGEVGGSVRTLSGSININGKINGNLTAAAGFVDLESNALVAKNVLMGAGNLEFRGKIGRDLIGGGGNVLIGGEIGKNVKLWLNQNIKAGSKISTEAPSQLTLTDNAKINGNLTYSSVQAASIASSTSVKGQTQHNIPQAKELAARGLSAIFGWLMIIALFAAWVLGLVLVSLWKDEIKKITDLMQAKFWPSLGWGAVILFLTPIIIIILLFTLIGIPLALIMGALWLIAVGLSKILAAILAGRYLIEKFWNKQKDSMFLAMILGVLLLWIICLIPVIGFAVAFVVTLWGLGGLWLYFKKT